MHEKEMEELRKKLLQLRSDLLEEAQLPNALAAWAKNISPILLRF
jgi:hypothetical protein